MKAPLARNLDRVIATLPAKRRAKIERRVNELAAFKGPRTYARPWSGPKRNLRRVGRYASDLRNASRAPARWLSLRGADRGTIALPLT